MRPKLIYFAYPYSSDPEVRTEEIRQLILGLIEVRKDIVPIVPHFTIDAIFKFPKGYSHFFVTWWELEIIANVHYICFPPPPPDIKSAGCIWEKFFAKWFGTPEIGWDYLLAGGEI